MGAIETFKIVGSLIAGGLITFFCSKYYYEKAGKELNKEASELRRLTNLILLGLESAGLMTLTRDDQGYICGFALKIHAQEAVSVITGTSPVVTQTGKGEEEGTRSSG